MEAATRATYSATSVSTTDLVAAVTENKRYLYNIKQQALLPYFIIAIVLEMYKTKKKKKINLHNVYYQYTRTYYYNIIHTHINDRPKI